MTFTAYYNSISESLEKLQRMRFTTNLGWKFTNQANLKSKLTFSSTTIIELWSSPKAQEVRSNS